MTIDSRNHSPFFPSCFVRDSSQNILGGWQSKKFLSVKVFITWSEENKLRGYVRTAEKTIVFFTEMFSSVPENIRNGDFISLREWIGKKKGELEHASEFKFLACFDPYEPLPNRFIGIQADDIKHGNWVVNATWEVRMSLDRRSKQLFTSIQTPDSLYWFNEEGGRERIEAEINRRTCQDLLTAADKLIFRFKEDFSTMEFPLADFLFEKRSSNSSGDQQEADKMNARRELKDCLEKARDRDAALKGKFDKRVKDLEPIKKKINDLKNKIDPSDLLCSFLVASENVVEDELVRELKELWGSAHIISTKGDGCKLAGNYGAFCALLLNSGTLITKLIGRDHELYSAYRLADFILHILSGLSASIGIMSILFYNRQANLANMNLSSLVGKVLEKLEVSQYQVKERSQEKRNQTASQVQSLNRGEIIRELAHFTRKEAVLRRKAIKEPTVDEQRQLNELINRCSDIARSIGRKKQFIIGLLVFCGGLDSYLAYANWKNFTDVSEETHDQERVYTSLTFVTFALALAAYFYLRHQTKKERLIRREEDDDLCQDLLRIVSG